eukprot:7562524-Alexandrium_andersonii.AAC.1
MARPRLLLLLRLPHWLFPGPRQREQSCLKVSPAALGSLQVPEAMLHTGCPTSVAQAQALCVCSELAVLMRRC